MEGSTAHASAAPTDYEHQFERAKALFEGEKFAESRGAFEGAARLKGADEKKCALWIRKCNTHIADVAQTAPTPLAPAPATMTTAPAQVAVSHNVRFEWFQTSSAVALTFFVKNRTKDDVHITPGPHSLDVTIKLGDGHEYTHDIDHFFALVDDANMKVEIKPMKIEVTLPKAQPGFQWPVLEAPLDVATATAVPNPAMALLPKTASELPVPNSKGRDWAKFKLSEEDEKLEGDQALNKFFSDIFKNATDEQRLAMKKSFQESNGTVLSTNPAEVLNKKVECQPPKGMEVKKWEY